MSESVSVRFAVNGRPVSVSVAPHRLLLDVLRDQLGLKGAKGGCHEGGCGACTVLLDGMPIRSCLMYGVQADGCEITTIEGLGDEHRLGPIQAAFVQHGATQCGFCAPGIILMTKALLDEIPSPTEEQIRVWLAGNMCRCTGYLQIIEAIHSLASQSPGDRRHDGAGTRMPPVRAHPEARGPRAT